MYFIFSSSTLSIMLEVHASKNLITPLVIALHALYANYSLKLFEGAANNKIIINNYILSFKTDKNSFINLRQICIRISLTQHTSFCFR